MSDAPQGPDWWAASDGKYYPPETHPNVPPPPPPQHPGSLEREADGWWKAKNGRWYPEGIDAPDQKYPFQKNAGGSGKQILIGLCVVALVAAGAIWWMDGGTKRDLDARWNDMTSDERDAICTVNNLAGVEGVTNLIINADGNSSLDRADVREWVEDKVTGCV